MPDTATAYRAAALVHMERLKVVDFFLANSADPRLAWTAVSLTLNLTSTRGWILAEVAEAIGVSESTLACQKAKFVKMIGLGSMV